MTWLDGGWVDAIMSQQPDYTIGNTLEDVVFEGWILQESDAGVIHLHRIVRADAPACFHGHPYKAFRIILRGGYVEESVEHWWQIDTVDPLPTRFRNIEPGYHGPVGKEFYHRIDRLLDGPSVSLWFTAPGRSPFRLIGEGWGEKHGTWIK